MYSGENRKRKIEREKTADLFVGRKKKKNDPARFYTRIIIYCALMDIVKSKNRKGAYVGHKGLARILYATTHARNARYMYIVGRISLFVYLGLKKDTQRCA